MCTSLKTSAEWHSYERMTTLLDEGQAWIKKSVHAGWKSIISLRLAVRNSAMYPHLGFSQGVPTQALEFYSNLDKETKASSELSWQAVR